MLTTSLSWHLLLSGHGHGVVATLVALFNAADLADATSGATPLINNTNRTAVAHASATMALTASASAASVS